MICITVYKNREQDYTAFRCMGHAGYAVSGEDIVCAAVSVLVINTINSVEQLVSDRFQLVTDADTGQIDFSLKEGYSEHSLLLLRSLVLGLQGIQKNYGKKYVSLTFEEV